MTKNTRALLIIGLTLFPTILRAEKSYRVSCEFPKREGDGTFHQIEMGQVSGTVSDKTLRVKDQTYWDLRRRCERLETFPQRDINASLIAVDAGRISSDYYPVGSQRLGAAYHEVLAKARVQERSSEETAVVFFHGTGSSPRDLEDENYRRSSGELLANLEQMLILNGAEEGVDFLRVHGVGSGNLQITNLHANFMVQQAYSHTSGQALGRGVDENIEHALLALKGETHNPSNEEAMIDKAPRVARVGRVVLVGWSRGAVTAINFAQRLYHDPVLRNLEVYIFAVDPVPGLGNITLGMWKNIYYLYPNVKKYFGVYARDERSVGFTPLIPVEVDSEGIPTGRNANRVIAEFPGSHATLVGNVQDEQGKENKKLLSCPRAVRGLAQQFILAYSNRLQAVEYYKGQAGEAPNHAGEFLGSYLLEDFDLMMKRSSEFEKLQQKAYLGVTQRVGVLRKYHEHWNLFSSFFRPMDTVVNTIAPRYSAEFIPGFHYKADFKGSDRIYVNWLHRVLSEHPDRPLDELFSYEGVRPH